MKRSPGASTNSNPPKTKSKRVPTAEDFTSGAVQKAVLAQTVQHPVTLGSAGICTVSLLYILLLQDASAAPVLLCFASGLVSACSWVVNFFIRGEILVQRHIQKLMELRSHSMVDEVESVQREFSASGFTEAVHASQELDEAYQKLRRFLKSKVSEKNLGAQRFIALAEDVYREGVVVLHRALNIFQALKDIDQDKLEDELIIWRRKLSQLQQENKTGQSGEIDAFSRRINGHERRLERYHNRANLLQELLVQCEELEGALETAYLDVVDVIDSDAETLFHGNAASQLEGAVQAARRVEERLRGIGTDTREEDDMYLQAGSDNRNT